MENQTALSSKENERQSEQNKLIQLRARRASEWRSAANRMDAAGQPGTALLFRNEAYRIEQESKQ